MKNALFVLALLSLLMCCLIGWFASKVEVRTGYPNQYESPIRVAAASTYSAGAIGAGLIGSASAVGAALIQMSERRH